MRLDVLAPSSLSQDDCSVLYGLTSDPKGESDMAKFLDSLKAGKVEDEFAKVSLVRTEDQIVGWSVLENWLQHSSGRRYLIMSVYVREDFRKRGLGTQLVMSLVPFFEQFSPARPYIYISEDQRSFYLAVIPDRVDRSKGSFEGWKNACCKLLKLNDPAIFDNANAVKAHVLGWTPEAFIAALRKRMSKAATERRMKDGARLETRKNRKTGVTVALEYWPGEEPDCRWNTVCDNHGSICGHATRKQAEGFLAVPWEWCEDCREPAQEEKSECIK